MSVDSDSAMQHYLHLQAQHSVLLMQLDALRSASTSTPAYTPAGPLPASTSTSALASSTRRTRHYSPSSRRSSLNAAAGLWPAAVLFDDDHLDEERRLSDLNEDIKRTLTELLNCDEVRKDSGRRLWVQSRLMETERELRSERRRRSAASVEA